MTDYNKILERADIECVCGAVLHESDLWCPRCRVIAIGGRAVRVPSGFDNSDMVWVSVLACVVGIFIGIILMSNILGAIYE